MTSIDTQMSRLDMIREMERAGCDIAYHGSTMTNECTVTVYWRGWSTHVIRHRVYDLERAYTEWSEYRDSVSYRVMSHQDQPRSAVRPQERRRRSRRVMSRVGRPTPHVAKAVAQEKGAA